MRAARRLLPLLPALFALAQLTAAPIPTLRDGAAALLALLPLPAGARALHRRYR